MATQSFRDIYSYLPPPSECFALLVGCMELTVFGLGGLANPMEFGKGYGLPMTPATTSQAHPGALEASSDEKQKAGSVQKTQEAYIAAIAARNIQNGVLILTLGLYVKDRRAMGIALMAGLVATVGDALIVQAYGVPSAVWGHLIGVFNSVAIGGSLLYWGRTDPWW
ncbi:hypothetical protein BAUCODRAFT_150281 [Baudoinia panamericana UAMH 10762]|uniref:Uncharacterized protein n=1 Tax=Baudoinia panamericana (strain UAMH 10762) TaxID=717646 RepID=M2N5M7_BAUPA|nr:uncharacterized protein BAUCODRAFT_150281 [Baudoinia panamericana UAMH 10762]EMC94060.1 hypothetical protein BAUCODRAFT_150281 [Baudoinia panamericana UAMH 10762]